METRDVRRVTVATCPADAASAPDPLTHSLSHYCGAVPHSLMHRTPSLSSHPCPLLDLALAPVPDPPYLGRPCASTPRESCHLPLPFPRSDSSAERTMADGRPTIVSLPLILSFLGALHHHLRPLRRAINAALSPSSSPPPTPPRLKRQKSSSQSPFPSEARLIPEAAKRKGKICRPALQD